MADNHAGASDDVMDMPAHEEMYKNFLAMTEIGIVTILCIVLLLIIWTLEGHGGVALIGFFVTLVSAVIGGLTGLTWRAILPVFLLLGLVAVVVH